AYWSAPGSRDARRPAAASLSSSKGNASGGGRPPASDSTGSVSEASPRSSDGRTCCARRARRGRADVSRRSPIGEEPGPDPGAVGDELVAGRLGQVVTRETLGVRDVAPPDRVEQLLVVGKAGLA